MNPSKRLDWQKRFAELREWIASIPEAGQTGEWAVCHECERKLNLLRGKRSGKFFWSHADFAGCQNVRAIFFTTKQEAMEAEMVFL